MDSGAQSPQQRTRAAALSTGIGAAILLYLGFGSMEPAREDLAGWCLWTLFQTLRIGGVLSAGVTLLLLTGWRHALLIDAVSGVLIGFALAATALGWLVFGGFNIQAVVGVIGGWLFISSGWRNGQIYLGFQAAPVRDQVARAPVPEPLPTFARTSQREEDLVVPLADVSPADGASPPVSAAPSPPPAEGYLAALAAKRSKGDGGAGDRA